MNEEQLVEIRKQLKTAQGYSMVNWLFSAINEALENDEAIKSLFDDYYECSLKYFGVDPLPTA